MNLSKKSPEASLKMASIFYRFISLGYFMPVQQDVPELSEISMSAILKYAN